MTPSTIPCIQKHFLHCCSTIAAIVFGCKSYTIVFFCCWLHFSDPPTLTGKPDPTEYVNLGASLTLSCVATSNELATIQWYKDNVKVFHGDGIHEITVSSNSPIDQVTSTIKVNPVILDTLGAYTCNATNSLGFEKFTTNVVVYCKMLCTHVTFRLIHSFIISRKKRILNNKTWIINISIYCIKY